jgi:hypothetical protein
LYRAVDREGKTVDFRLSSKRDVAAANAFFREAIKGQGSNPRTITLDGYAASHRAVREMKAEGQMPTDTKLRSSKYLNNLIDQDHRGVKARVGPMLGFKRFRTAVVTIAGIELLRRIRKGQFNLRRLRLNGRGAPAIWNTVRQRSNTGGVRRRHCPAPPLVYLHQSLRHDVMMPPSGRTSPLARFWTLLHAPRGSSALACGDVADGSVHK